MIPDDTVHIKRLLETILDEVRQLKKTTPTVVDFAPLTDNP